MITETELCGITTGPISVDDFLNKNWRTLFLPNGEGQLYKSAGADYFSSPKYRDGERQPQAHLNILIDLIRKWKKQLAAEIYAVLLFGSSVRIPNKVWETRGSLWWKREVEVDEKIYPQDIDVLLLTDATRQQVAKTKHQKWGFHFSDGSCIYTEWVHSMGFDINGLTPNEYLNLVGDYEHECQVPNNVLKEGVLVAGECDFANLLKTKRQVEWNEHFGKCVVS